MHLPKILVGLFSCGAFALGANPLLAIAPEPYTCPVSFSLRLQGDGISGHTGSGVATVTGQPGDTSSLSVAYYQTSESSIKTASWRPGKKYTVTVSGNDATDYSLSLIAPDDYEIYIDGNRTNLLTQLAGSAFSDSYQVEIRAAATADRAPAGAFSGISLGGAVAWNVGLGGLPADRSAGRINFREFDLTSTPDSRDRLYYEPELTTGLTLQKVIRDGSSGQVLRQIMMPQVFVDLVDDTHGYTMYFYTPDSATFGGTNYTIVSGHTPWKTIHVELVNSGATLEVTETQGSVTKISRLTLTSGTVSSGNQVWTLQEGDGSTWPRITTLTSSVPSSGVREAIVEVSNGTTVATKTKYHYENPGWGEELITEVTNPDGGSDALTRTFTYHTDNTSHGNYRKVESITEPNGQWVAYDYYDDWDRLGQRAHEYHPSPLDNLPATYSLSTGSGRVLTYDYAFDWSNRKRIVSSVIEEIGGTATGLTSTTPSNTTVNSLLCLQKGIDASYDSTSGHSLHTTTVAISEGGTGTPLSWEFLGKPLATIRPDKTQDSFLPSGYGTYAGGTFNSAGTPWTHWRDVKFSGTSDTGAAALTSYDSISIVPIYLVNRKSTMEISISDLTGQPIRTEKHVYDGSGFTMVSYENLAYDSEGHLHTRSASNGAVTTYDYTDGRLTRVTDSAGTVIEYSNFDAVGRPQDMTKKAVSGGTDIVTRYVYDASDRIISETVGQGQTETLVTLHSFDKSGRPTSVTPPGLGATTITYDQTNRKRTTTAPSDNGGTTVETYQLDGRIASITGSAVVDKIYTYSLDSGGLLTRCDHGDSNRYEKTWTDWLGRKFMTERPGWTGQPTFVEKFDYDATTGLLTTYERRDGSNNRMYSDIAYEYDNHAQLASSGLDLANNGLSLSSSDRITDTARYIEPIGSDWWLHEETTIYPVAGNGTTHTASLVRTRLSGFTGSIRSEVVTTTTNGAVITETVSVNTGTKTVTKTTSQAGINDHTETVVNGLPGVVTDSDGLTHTNGYDTLGRLSTTTEIRTGATTTVYKTGTLLPSTVSDSTGLLVSFDYDNSGRKTKQGNGAGKFARFDYNERNQLRHQWGDTVNPVEHTYSSTYGDHVTQITYLGGSNWNSATWAGVTTGTGNTVTWAYHAATGLLNSKTDALGHAVNFTYNDRGKVATRVADRGPSSTVTTSYTYDGITGELTGVGYTGGVSTPSVAYWYDRLGHVYRVDDATGTRTFDLCYCGRVSAEYFDTTTTNYYGTRVLTLQYETSGGVVGRYKGFQLGSSLGSNSDLEQDYTYTSGGRFDALASSRTGGSVGRTFQYGYLSNSSLVNALSITTGSHPYTVAKGYNSARELLESVDSKWSGTTQTRFDYGYDASTLRRQTAKQSGPAFADYWTGTSYSSVYNAYAYNDRGELQTAAMYRGNSGGTVTFPASSGDELPGHRFEYRYDTNGNRLLTRNTASATANDDDYTTDGTNRYTAKKNNLVQFAGTVSTSFNVALAGGTASRLDRVWGGSLTPANSTAMSKASVNVFAANPGAGTAGADILRTQNIAYQVPARAQSLGYDYAGNLTGDGLWVYTYDGEDRLVSMETDSAAIGPGKLANSDARRLEFTYDYLGRRVEKIVRDGRNSSTGVYSSTPIVKTRYLYDDWNVIAEFDARSTLTLAKSYTWGLDVQGSLSTTGGVGALLQIRDHLANGGSGRTWLPTYDGNGNIVSLLDAESGGAAIAAVYEYGPFGEPLRTEVLDGDAVGQTFRFSTKFTDEETGLVYYGHRFYSATLGRFINRDPSEEQGGMNLYRFAGNDGVNGWDVLGLNDVQQLTPIVVHPRPAPPPAPTPDSSGGVIIILPLDFGEFDGWVAGTMSERPPPTFVLTLNAPNKPSPDCLKVRAALADALNARAAYGGDPAPGWKPADAAALGLDPSMFANNKSGFGAVLLQNEATGALQVSYRGTDPALNDWGNNFAQGLGFTGSQYQQAVNVATSVNFAAGQRGLDLTFTGHSLGGGMAAAGAMAVSGGNLNYPLARTFNAAGVNILTTTTYNLNLRSSDRIDAYYVRGDPLHVFQMFPLTPSADGNRIALNGTGRFGSIERHSINTVIASLEKEVAEKCK